MKKLLLLMVIGAVMVSGVACSGGESLKVPTLAEHNALVEVVNQHKAVLDDIQARYDDLEARLQTWSDEVVGWSELLAEVSDENADVINSVIEQVETQGLR